HSDFNLTNNQFENNGLYLAYEDNGRERITLQPRDAGKFRVPTLRNIALTAPYMHDGSLLNLEAVIEHYSNGGKNHPNKHSLIRPLQLTPTDKADLMAFLDALTDRQFDNSEG
ncbi:MAG: cytochrome-c peroxidase, partial [Bacteroidota bacterium]